MILLLTIAVAVLAWQIFEMRGKLRAFEADVDERIGLLQRQRIEALRGDGPAAVPEAQAARPLARYDGPARISRDDPSPPVAAAQEPAQPEVVAAPPADAPSDAPSDPAPDPAPRSGPWVAAAEGDAAADEPDAAPTFIDRLRPSGFEDLFGRKLPIWAGGVTLLVAAVLLVRFSIEAGLLSPWVRVVSGLAFGGGLIGGAELARRFADRVQDPRVAQALAGAGLGALYAAILSAHMLYALVGPATAFAGLTLVTALAMGLALRFGAPCALLALVGGLATPGLVRSDAPNVPLLAAYLAMIIGSLTLLSRRQRWFWLGATALAGGLGWSLVVILAGTLDRASVTAIGLLVILLGFALPAWDAAPRRDYLLRAGGAVIASLQIALLVSTAGYDALSWGLYGLLSLAFLVMIERQGALRPFVAVPLIAALGLAAYWPEPPVPMLAAVLAGIAVIFGGGVLRLVWRAEGTSEQALHVALAALGSCAVALWQLWRPERAGEGALALASLGFMALPVAGIALGWRNGQRGADLRFAILAGAAAMLLACALWLALPAWLAPVAIALAAAALLPLAARSGDGRLVTIGLAFAACATLVLTATATGRGELSALFGLAVPGEPGEAAVRWGLIAPLWAALAWAARDTRFAAACGTMLGLTAYGLIAQIVPAPWLAGTTAGLLAAAAFAPARPDLRPAHHALMAALGLVAFGWMAGPMFDWLRPAAASLLGEPMLVIDVPAPARLLRGLLLPALLCALAAWRLRGRAEWLPPGLLAVVAAIPAGIAMHGLYKQLFAIDGPDRFVALGLAERTLWEAALVAAGYALWQWRRDRAAPLLLFALAAGHGVWHSLLLHNPLFAAQAVGDWPVANLLLPSLGLLFALPLLLRRVDPPLAERLRGVGEMLQMAALLLFGLMTLRQLFAGSVFAHQPVGQGESIGWSVLAIAMAVGWLLWGLRRQRRNWRIGSLLLMLAAIAKVFLVDASGLTGLLRILSFLALGFSLIGIGWLYSRTLRGQPAAAAD